MSDPQTTYNEKFYASYLDSSRNSARKIVPFVLELLSPGSVVDVGCGIGTWLSVFKEKGIEDLSGVDGSYVSMDQLLIPKESFIPHDLSKPIRLGRSFDLVICMEVAEHLPAEYADSFVESLTTLGRAILFSAAIPHQGGAGHINQQWPEYWAQMFAKRSYYVLDCIRPAVWQDRWVAYYYAQNTLLYIHEELLSRKEHLRKLVTSPSGLARVHPLKWESYIKEVGNAPCMMTPRELIAEFPASLRRSLKYRFDRFVKKMKSAGRNK